MALRGDYLQIRVQQDHSSTTEVVAESTSCEVDFSAEFLETTSQDSGLFTSGIGGKVTGTVSGDFLHASDSGNWTDMITNQWAGTVVEVEVYSTSTAIVKCSGVITNISSSGGNSDQLVTGSYSIALTGDPNP